MSKTIWHQKTGDIQSCIDWLISAFGEHKAKTGQPGWPGSMKLSYVLEELRCAISQPTTTGQVMGVLQRMIERDMSTVDEFAEVYGSVPAEPASPSKRWTFHAPILAFLADDVDHFDLKILGVDFSIQRSGDTARFFGVDDMESKSLYGLYPAISRQRSSKTFITFEGAGASFRGTWKNVEPAYNALIGFLQFTYGRGSSRYGGGLSPRAKFPHLKWIIAKSEDGEIDTVQFEIIEPELPDHRVHQVTRVESESFMRRSHFLSDIPDDRSTVSLIADGLRIYAQALEGQYRSNVFLSFWQLLEVVTCAESVGGSTRHVRSRISWHAKRVGLPGSGISNLLRCYAEKRNDVVHRGLHPVNDDDVNLLKWTSEIALDWLIDQIDHLPTRHHLEYFYMLRDAGETKISAVQETADYIIKDS